jgi:hypothetical protein
MIGPPFWKLSMKKFLLSAFGAGAAAAGLVSGAIVAETAEAGLGAVAGAPAVVVSVVVVVAGLVTAPGAAGMAGEAARSAGEVATAAGELTAAGALASGVVAGAAAGLWAWTLNASEMEQRLTISVFFILNRLVMKFPATVDAAGYPRGSEQASSKNFLNFLAASIH